MGSICFPRKQKIEISGGLLIGLLLVPICRVSPNSSATVVAALPDLEIRNGADRRRPRAPAPSAGGRRTHSPGAAHPSLVWLPTTLGTLCLIFCKARKISVSYWSKWRINCRPATQIGPEARRKPHRAGLVPAGVQRKVPVGAGLRAYVYWTRRSPLTTRPMT